MPSDGARRTEILDTAAALFASAGLQSSLKEIADACGILPGSLYHHFDSKEAIIVELVQRYRDDLDRVAQAAVDTLKDSSARPAPDRVLDLGRQIADCAVRHRAALLLTLYEPPAVLGDEIYKLARQTPSEIQTAMVAILDQGRTQGTIRAGIDLGLLAERLCQSMLHVGVGVSHLTPGAEHVPELRMSILLNGIGTATPANSTLDRSPAMKTTRDVVAGWDGELEDDDRTHHLKAVARREFGKRGYESTTMRDIASAAGLSTGTVYRAFRSKDELLSAIMQTYWANAKRTWDAALHSGSTPLEKLDALMWANIAVVERFTDEFKVQLAWLRQSPPSGPNLDFSFAAQLRQIKALLAEGSRQGDLRIDGAPADVRARCVFEVIMMSPTIIEAAGAPGAHALARDTVLRGATVAPASR